MPDTTARGSLLETLRLSRALTQNDLASASEISQATLSKVESGLIDLDPERWAVLAEILHVPVAAFDDANRPVHPARVFHRKKKGTPKGALVKIGADAALTSTRVNALMAATPVVLNRYGLEDGFVTPQEVAERVRADLHLGDGPIRDLVEVAETAGVIVLRWLLDSLQVDAIATWPEEGSPVILLGEHAPAERQRFTIAHEIGHAVMHGSDGVDGDQERQADAFAGELLLPAARLREEWPAVPAVENLLPLKRRWGISLSALIRRANETGLLTDRDYRGWNIQLSSTGMNRREPDPLQPEQPTRLRSVIFDAQAGGATIDDLAARAHMLPREFTDTFLEGTA